MPNKNCAGGTVKTFDRESWKQKSQAEEEKRKIILNEKKQRIRERIRNRAMDSEIMNNYVNR